MNIKIKAVIGGLLAVVAGAVSANAQTLGVNYLELSGSYTQFKVPGFKYDTIGGGLNANYALSKNRNYGVDLQYGAGLAVDNKKNFTLQHQGVGAGLVAYYNLASDIRLFVSGGAGYSWNRTATALGKTKSNSWFWSAGAGLEWTFAEGLSIAPSVSYTDHPDFHKAESIDFSAELNWWLTSTFAVGVAYTYGDLNSGESNTGVLSLKYRY